MGDKRGYRARARRRGGSLAACVTAADHNDVEVAVHLNHPGMAYI
jgi:hypothetical protein